MHPILVVDDEQAIAMLIRRILTDAGYRCEAVTDSIKAADLLEKKQYDLVLLDIMMPGFDGIEVLKRLRKGGLTTPALFLTARTEVSQRVEGLDAGADDYLPKPFSTSELLARVRAMLRRKDNYVPDLLTYNDVVLNRSTYELGYDNKTQTLSGKEFQIAEMMMQQPNSIIATEQFITHIWGWDSHVDTSVVWVHISNLRKKIDAVNAPIEIRFVRNAGYILEDKQ